MKRRWQIAAGLQARGLSQTLINKLLAFALGNLFLQINRLYKARLQFGQLLKENFGSEPVFFNCDLRGL